MIINGTAGSDSHASCFCDCIDVCSKEDKFPVFRLPLLNHFLAEPVEIRIYVDSIQILNYPGLAKWINFDYFKEGKIRGRKYRNRRIGELFKEIDLSEKKGTGIPKILRELKKNGSPVPEFDMDDDRTYLNTIIRIRDGFEMSESMSESMSELVIELNNKSMSELEQERMRRILAYLVKYNEINSARAAEFLPVPGTR